MIKRILALLAALVMLTPAVPAEYWDADWTQPVVCSEGRIGCQVLQMVMMGSFDVIDPDDRLNVRVLSAAYSKLKSVTKDDFEHFLAEFDVEEHVLRSGYYIALGCCLWADILMDSSDDVQEEEARQVLLLFLDPSLDETNGQQIRVIRSLADDKTYEEMARRTGLSADFIRYLIQSENWHDGLKQQ